MIVIHSCAEIASSWSATASEAIAASRPLTTHLISLFDAQIAPSAAIPIPIAVTISVVVRTLSSQAVEIAARKARSAPRTALVYGLRIGKPPFYADSILESGSDTACAGSNQSVIWREPVGVIAPSHRTIPGSRGVSRFNVIVRSRSKIRQRKSRSNESSGV